MMKASWLLICLCVFSGPIGAEPTDACAGLQGIALSQCRSDQQSLKQQQLEQQFQQQQDRQNQLDKQQRDMQQQLQNMRVENESLRKQVERESTTPAARPIAADYSKSADIKRWKADNPWFGSDYGKTQFATRYIKQLQQERPDLTGRDLLDAVSTKVNETFAAKH